MGLRLVEGIDLAALSERFDIPVGELVDPERFDFYQQQGLVWRKDMRIGVTAAGMPLLDALLGELVPAGLVTT
jgi:oxygen-independent coproporphyrinogen-3 oxidase